MSEQNESTASRFSGFSSFLFSSNQRVRVRMQKVLPKNLCNDKLESDIIILNSFLCSVNVCLFFIQTTSSVCLNWIGCWWAGSHNCNHHNADVKETAKPNRWITISTQKQGQTNRLIFTTCASGTSPQVVTSDAKSASRRVINTEATLWLQKHNILQYM